VSAETRERGLGRDFLLLWQGQLVSQLGNQAFLVAIMSWTLDATGSVRVMSLFLIASTLPAVLLGPIGGAIADRHSRRTVIVVADLLRGLAHLALAGVLFAAPDATRLLVALVVVLGFASGALGAVLTPALAAAIPDLVPARRLAAANSLQLFSNQAATMVGQAAAGIAYAAIGAAALVLFDGATFVVSAACASFARVPSPPERPIASVRDEARAYLREARDGAAWLWRNPSLRRLTLGFAAVNFLFTPVFVLLPIYVRDILGRGPQWYGILLAGAAAGAMGGAALAPTVARKGLAVAPIFSGIGACTVALGVTDGPASAAALLAGIGTLSGIANVRVITTLQLSTPAELRGRVLAVTIALASATVPAGLGLGGVVGGLAPSAVATTIAACGAGILVVALSSCVRTPAGKVQRFTYALFRKR
jgi:MFS family permease